MLELAQMIASLFVSIVGFVHNSNETNDEAFFAELKVKQECVQPLTRDGDDILHSAGDPICKEEETVGEMKEVEKNAEDS